MLREPTATQIMAVLRKMTRTRADLRMARLREATQIMAMGVGRVVTEAEQERTSARRVTALGVAKTDFILPEDLQRLVIRHRGAEGGGDFRPEVLLAVAQLVKHDPFAVAGLRPDLHFDIRPDTGYTQGRVT